MNNKLFEGSSFDSTLSEVFTRQVAESPEADAVRDRSQVLTFRELDRRSAALAVELVARCGSAPEPVAFLTPHDANAVVALMGILRAGKIAVPLDPLQPAAIQQGIVAQCGAPVVVTSSEARSRAEATAAPLIDLDRIEPADPSPPLPDLTGEASAVILYTSGTTGAPKGVVSTHRCELHSVWTVIDRMKVRPGDRVGVVMPLNYRFALAFSLSALLSGAAVCLYDLRSDGFPGLPDWLSHERVSVLPLVPTILRGLGAGAVGERQFPDVRTAMIAGERAEPSDVETAHGLFAADVQVVHAFATTETQLVAMYDLWPGEPIAAPVPVGPAAPDKVIEVVDGEGRPLGMGQMGEVVVQSRFLPEGYWHRPDLTDLVYGPGDADGERRYRTGDLGIVRQGGVLELYGREDGQVKVRGHRVDIADVEAALLDLDAVESAVVVAQPADDQLALVAYATLAPGSGHLSPASLRSALEEVLPDFAVPSAIVVLAELPLLPNAKVDRRALPTVDIRVVRASAQRPANHDAANALEKEVLRLWEAVLEVSPIELDDDLVDLSDRSLDAARLVVAMEESLGVRIPISTLVSARTPRAMAQVVESLREDASKGPESLVALSPDAPQPAPRLLLCPDLSGSPFRFRALADALGPDVALLGFESPLFTDPKAAVRTVEELAAHNIEQAVTADPVGPYHLVGWSVGGFVAFEMARQLAEQGLAVGAVVIIDAGPHMITRSYAPFSEARRRSRRSPRPTVDLADVDTDGHVVRLVDALLPTALADRLVWWYDVHRQGQIRPQRRLPYVWRSNWRAARDYRFGSLDREVTFVTSQRRGAPDPTSGLVDHVTGEIVLAHVVGEHERLVFEPMVEGVAEACRQAITRQERLSGDGGSHRA